MLAVGAALVLAGCGNEKERGGSFGFNPSKESRDVRFAESGMTLAFPVKGVPLRRAKSPGVFRAAIGQGVVAGFAYRRREQLPRDERELKQALRRLKRAARERSDSLKVISARTTRIAGARSVELLADQTLSRGRLRTRSVHVYKGEAEYVIEILAPRDEFDKLDRTFTPLVRRTLEVTGEIRPDRG